MTRTGNPVPARVIAHTAARGRPRREISEEGTTRERPVRPRERTLSSRAAPLARRRAARDSSADSDGSAAAVHLQPDPPRAAGGTGGGMKRAGWGGAIACTYARAAGGRRHWPAVQNSGARAVHPSDAQLLAHQAAHLAAIGAALGLAHDRADDRPDRLLVASSHALGRIGVGLQRRRDNRGELLIAVQCREPLSLDDRGRIVAALGHELVEHLPGGAHAHAL